MIFTKDELIKATDAKILKDCNSAQNYIISTDTRTINSQNIYLPLKGETFDGENFIRNAIYAGAKAYFTTKNEVADGAQLVLKVEDTKVAYLKIANYFRHKINPRVICITGSSGKTTTKEMVYSVLSQKFKTQKTFSNHNNEIGFCQTVLSMNKDTQMLVVEAGMRGLGEIELISKYLEPDYAIITNSGCAHVGRLGSIDNIAIAKCEITKGLKSNGTFIAKDQEIIKKHVKYNGEKIYYSLKDTNILEKSTGYTKFEYLGKVYELNVDGDYNIENSLAAINLGIKLGIEYEKIKKGLFEYKPIEKRWETQRIGNFNIINDSYNANPESMQASVKTFLELYEKPVIILGDMGELGDNSAFYHRQVGEFISNIASKDVIFITVGSLAAEIGNVLKEKGLNVVKFSNNTEAVCYIVENLNSDYTILLKASRSMKFEEIIEKIGKGTVK